MKLKWKDIYNSNKDRRFCEITGIKKEDVEIKSNSFKVLKEKKHIVLVIAIILIAILLYTFRNDIKIFFMVIGFFVVAGACFFIFNYFKLKCTKDGLYVRFGLQEGLFKYDKVKSVYLSKFNDYSFLIPARTYSVVIRYIDNNNKIKELSFANHFLDKQETLDFLENFEIKELQEERYVNFEKFKVLKKVAKITLIVLLVLFIIGSIYMGK